MYKVIFLIFLMLLTGCKRDPTVACYSHFYDQEYQKAYSYCKESSESGRDIGSYLLGMIYASSEFVDKDEVKGFNLVEIAAKSGISNAQKDLGIMYQYGIGTEINMINACRWWEKSAHNNNFLARQYIGACYIAGQGKPKDLPKGLAYLKWAKESGNKEVSGMIEKVKLNVTETELIESDILFKNMRNDPEKH